MVEPELKPESVKIETPKVETPVKTEIPKVNVTIQDVHIEEATKEPEVKRIGTATLIVPDQNGMIPVSDTILNIVASLTEYDKLQVIIRKIQPCTCGVNNGVTIYANQISQIRRGVEYTYIYNGNFSRKMKDRICKRQSNFRFLSAFEKACCIMYCTPEELGISESIYTDVAKQLIKEHHLNFEDGRSWKGLPMFDKLKKIYMGTVKKH